MKKLLIANRGEIACRIAQTARQMGLATVAVYSDADRDAKHVQQCDEAVAIGVADARQSYLNIEAVLAAAHVSGADAVHPGYGFLSENAEFARACDQFGLIFVGPSAQTIERMGDKASAKRVAAEQGVPLVPGYFGEKQDDETLLAVAHEVGFPLMIKATRGGGGRGLRIVPDVQAMSLALQSCRREAASGFGDQTLMVERYLTRPRHVEVQVLADRFGHCVSLSERDCSLQRRHQKVVEEAPAPGLSNDVRQRLGDSAVRLALAVGYEGAGTVEFVVDDTGGFYFLEMNTRLQVEHGVTEMITGIDLVEWQLRVARGEPLAWTQRELNVQGHCFEVRLCAERPQKRFLPSVGAIESLVLPAHEEFGGRHIRIDSGVRAGDTVTPFYDSMLAKVLVHDGDRQAAIQKMQQALAAIEVRGVETNLSFLKGVFSHAAFVAGDVHTGFLEEHLDALLNTTLTV